MTNHCKGLMNKLRKLATEGQTKLYERIGLAAKLWGNEEWVAEYVDSHGSLKKARHHFANEFFGEFSTQVGIEAVLEAYAYFGEEVWKQYRYNPVRMVILFREATDSTPRRPGRTTKAEVRRLKDRIEELEEEVAKLRGENTCLKEELKEKGEEVSRLRTEKARLEGRLAVYEEEDRDEAA